MSVEVAVMAGLAAAGFLYDRSEKFRYCAKFAVFLVLSLFFASVFIPLMLIAPRDYRNALYPAWGARQISKLLNLKWNMQGKENIVKGTGCVVLLNHQSLLDLLVLAEIWPVMKRCTVISKKEIFYLWPFGLACWLWGTVFIDRTRGNKAQNTVNQSAKAINARKAKIVMFPEGTRHGGNQLLPFKKGAFHIAVESQTPIQPVVVSKYYWLNDKTFKFNPGVNTISILPPIETKGMTKADIDNLIQKTYTVMSEEYKSLSML